MKIKLPWIKPFDALALPDDFEDQVKESFGRFTVDTNTRYTWKDKMLYISRLPMYFKNTIGTWDDDIAENEIVLDRNDIYSFEFMCQCFVDGMRYMELLQEYEPYSSGKNDEIEKVMFRIMQIVMNWEPEAEEQQGGPKYENSTTDNYRRTNELFDRRQDQHRPLHGNVSGDYVKGRTVFDGSVYR